MAGRELLLPLSLTGRVVDHARPSDVTEGYAPDWTIEQLRKPAQRIADRIAAMTNADRAGAPAGGEAEAPGAQAAEQVRIFQPRRSRGYAVPGIRPSAPLDMFPLPGRRGAAPAPAGPCLAASRRLRRAGA